MKIKIEITVNDMHLVSIHSSVLKKRVPELIETLKSILRSFRTKEQIQKNFYVNSW